MPHNVSFDLWHAALLTPLLLPWVLAFLTGATCDDMRAVTRPPADTGPHAAYLVAWEALRADDNRQGTLLAGLVRVLADELQHPTCTFCAEGRICGEPGLMSTECHRVLCDEHTPVVEDARAKRAAAQRARGRHGPYYRPVPFR